MKTWIVIKPFDVPQVGTNHVNQYRIGYEICEEEMFLADFRYLLGDRFKEFIEEKTE